MTGAAKPSHVNVRVSLVEVRPLAQLLATAAELDAGAIVPVDDTGVRVHPLPMR